MSCMKVGMHRDFDHKRSQCPVMPHAFDAGDQLFLIACFKVSSSGVRQHFSLLSDKISVPFHLTLLSLKLSKLSKTSLWPRIYSISQLCLTLKKCILLYKFLFWIGKRVKWMNWILPLALVYFFVFFVLQLLSSVLWVDIPVVSNLGWTHFHTRN